MMGWRKQRRFRSAHFLLLLIAFLVIATAQEEAAASSFGRYHALVIGNQDYKYLQDLKTPLSDAQEVAGILKEKYGFEVTLVLDGTWQATMRALERLGKKITNKEDSLLIYYAGHGYLDTSNDVGYWQPIDAEKDSVIYWISSSRLTNLLRGIRANHVLVIADSCFSGNLLTRDSGAVLDYGSEEWLRRMRTKKSRTAFTSGGEEPVVDSGGGNHSIFAKALIDILRNNNKPLDGRGLFDKVKRLVVANAHQTPMYGAIQMTGHEYGDFIFFPKGFKPSGKSKETEAGLDIFRTGDNSTEEQKRIKEDRDHWNVLSKKGNSGLEGYLALHPNGIYAREARRRLATSSPSRVVSISRPKPQPRQSVSKEEQAQALYEWQDDIIYANNSQAVEEFLQRFPAGSHVPDAKRKLAELRSQGL